MTEAQANHITYQIKLFTHATIGGLQAKFNRWSAAREWENGSRVVSVTISKVDDSPCAIVLYIEMGAAQGLTQTSTEHTNNPVGLRRTHG